MKVLALSNLYPPDVVGGYELACADVVEALRRRGHEVLVLTAAPRRPVDTPPGVLRRLHLIDEWSDDGMGVNPLAFRLDEAESRLVSAHNVHVLASTIEAFGPDVVYPCCLTGLGGFGLLACLEYLKVPWAWQLGDRIPHHLCSTRQRVIPGLASAFSGRIRGHYIVVSDQLRREIEGAGIRLAGHVETIPNWIKGGPGRCRSRSYRGGHLRIVSAGQVSRWKGSEILIRSAARLLALGFDRFSIDLYGEVVQPDLADLIRGLGLSDRVVLKGPVPQREILELYREYDVVAFPTAEREPFGMVPLEAMAQGCVPVLSRRCGIGEWLVHGVHALKAERDVESFAGLFAAILRGEIPLEPIARRGARVAWRDFHLDVILPRIERVLRAAATQSRAGAGTAADAFRLARLAEHLTGALIEEALCA